MPTHAALALRAHQPDSTSADLPQARDALRPELLAGFARAPLEWARSFHRFFFDVADLAIDGRGLLVLQDVVIGRPTPLLREIQLWGADLEPDDLLRMSAADIAEELDLAPDATPTICTEAVLFVGAVESAPAIDDMYLRRSITARLLVGTSELLGCLAPYVRIGGGVVMAYRAPGMFPLLAF